VVFDAIHSLPLFIAAGLLLNFTPGPDMLFIVGQAAANGRRAGVQAALGIGAGCLVHVLLAALGVSALLATSALAFTALKWIGAAYLVWVGLSMLRKPLAVAPQPVSPGASVFRQGVLTNVLNPKVALFFLAFLPQFIVPGAPAQVQAFIVLGLLFTFNGTLVCIAIALFAAMLRERLLSDGIARSASWLKRATGALFIGLGLRLAFSERD
jgi:threonine/homoserine/homoserine lactone efflux protein